MSRPASYNGADFDDFERYHGLRMLASPPDHGIYGMSRRREFRISPAY